MQEGRGKRVEWGGVLEKKKKKPSLNIYYQNEFETDHT